MVRLRDPDGGCPWDLEQDFGSLAPFAIEEAYEVEEAIASGDVEAIRAELGDLLFQVVFQARIAEEKGLFDFEGVADAIGEKLVRRHPHVFARAELPGSSEAQRQSWEDIKAAERAAAASEASPDPFDGIPRRLPALARSAKIAGRIEREAPSEAFPPAARAAEVIAAASSALTDSETSATEARRWVGRGLQAWVGLARSAGIDPEQALREADDAEIRRFRARASGPS